jgi:hypothetical protein
MPIVGGTVGAGVGVAVQAANKMSMMMLKDLVFIFFFLSCYD